MAHRYTAPLWILMEHDTRPYGMAALRAKWTVTEHITVAVCTAALVGGLLASQMSILRLGTDSIGSTVLVWRTGELSDLRFVDSAAAACKRAGVPGPSFICEGSLAAKILHEDLAILRWAVRGKEAVPDPNAVPRIPGSRM